MAMHLINIRKKDARNRLLNWMNRNRGEIAGMAFVWILSISFLLWNGHSSNNVSIPISTTDTTPVKIDSTAYYQNLFNNRVDTMSMETSLKEFNDFLYNKLNAKEYTEKFTPLFNYFIAGYYNEWLKNRIKKPKK